MQVQVTIGKPVLRELNQAVGKYDTDTGMVFRGFVGRLEMADRLYHGTLNFETASDERPESVVSINAIMGGVTNGDT